MNDEIVKFIDVKVVKDVKVENRQRHIGKVIFIDDGYPAIVCKKGLIGLVDIRDSEDKNLMINFRSRFE